MSDELKELADKVEQLEMSNQVLIAELGRIAQALGVEPSMKLVLDKITELKTSGPITLYRVTAPNHSSHIGGLVFTTQKEAEICSKDHPDLKVVTAEVYAAHLNKIYRLNDEVKELEAYTSYQVYVEEKFKKAFTDKQREMLGLK